MILPLAQVCPHLARRHPPFSSPHSLLYLLTVLIRIVPTAATLAGNAGGRDPSEKVFRRFRLSGLWHRVFMILRALERERNGKDPNPHGIALCGAQDRLYGAVASSAVVDQLDTEVLMAGLPCQVLPLRQQIPSCCIPSRRRG